MNGDVAMWMSFRRLQGLANLLCWFLMSWSLVISPDASGRVPGSFSSTVSICPRIKDEGPGKEASVFSLDDKAPLGRLSFDWMHFWFAMSAMNCLGGPCFVVDICKFCHCLQLGAFASTRQFWTAPGPLCLLGLGVEIDLWCDLLKPEGFEAYQFGYEQERRPPVASTRCDWMNSSVLETGESRLFSGA